MNPTTPSRSTRRRQRPAEPGQVQAPPVSQPSIVAPAATDTKALVQGAPAPTIPPRPEPAQSPDPMQYKAPPPAQPPGLILAGCKFQRFDAVQIVNQGLRTYGLFFIVADFRQGKVHGFHLTEGSKKEFITVAESDCAYVGASRVRSNNPCSPKWLSDAGFGV